MTEEDMDMIDNMLGAAQSEGVLNEVIYSFYCRAKEGLDIAEAIEEALGEWDI